MTIANDILFLALRNGGITGIGQTPSAGDINDSFKVLNAWINELNLERRVMVNTVVLPTFPGLTTDVSFWTPYEHVLLTSMSVRLRQIYALPPVDLDVQLALSALQAFQAINLQQLPMPVGLDPLSILFILNLALRAAGRINDKQNVDGGSQDAFDAQFHAVQMIEEWKREREVLVIPGDLPDLSGDIFSPPAGTLSSGVRNAIILNLGVRLQDAFGLPNNSALQARADRALQLIQAINLQQLPMPVGLDPLSILFILNLALRAAGRINDKQNVDGGSQDAFDAQYHAVQMIEEWKREREVFVIPGELPDLSGDVFSPPVGTLDSGVKNAIILNLGVRLQDAFGLPNNPALKDRADRALQLIQAINLQAFPAPFPSVVNPLSITWILSLALRAAGRLNDTQHIDANSYDFVSAQYHAVEMIEEWQREREVFVIPGDLPDFSGDPMLPPVGTLDSGVKNAIVLNLGVRLQDVFGLPANSALQTRADKALKLIQAINAQQIAPLATGVPATVRQACVLALRLAGRINDQQRVSDTSTDMNDALSLLVMMLGQWQRKRWLIWNEAETAKVATGSQWYSVGPGGDFNMPRPDKLHGGFVRFQPFAGPNPVDIPLAIIEAKEDWGKITIKDLKSIPEVMFYDSAFPLARVTFYPVPPSGLYELHIFTKAQLPVYVHLTDQLLVPPEYLDAIVNNLALRLPGAQITPLLLGQARASLETIRMANAQVSVLSLPGILGGRGGDVSSWSGRGLNRAWIVGSEAVL